MKSSKFFLQVLALFVLASFLCISSCSQTDDVKDRYTSRIKIGFGGIAFPDEDAPNCETGPCACFTSFMVTVSHFIVQRVDIADTEPFDLLDGRSYTFDAKKYMNGEVFYVSSTGRAIDPGVYEVQSLTVESVQASPILNGVDAMNDQLNSSLPAEAYLNLYMGAYCDYWFNIQEGYYKTIVLSFGCQGNVLFNTNTRIFSCAPEFNSVEAHCQ